jgi:hypothetical protein
MINHVSIAVDDPQRIANFIAELWDGEVFPFPPAPNSFFVTANDGRGTAVEVIPTGTVLVPGEGLPDEDDLDAMTEVHEAQFVSLRTAPKYVATHINISVNKSIDEIRSLAKADGWRVLVCNRGEGLFQLVEIWLEDKLMIEVMTPDQTQRYREITRPEFLHEAFADALKNTGMRKGEIIDAEPMFVG